MRCNAEFYYVGKIPPIGIGLQRRVVLRRFYSPRAVGTTLSEVHALRSTECLSSFIYFSRFTQFLDFFYCNMLHIQFKVYVNYQLRMFII